MTDATHIHMPSRREVKIKKLYDSIAVCLVDPYPALMPTLIKREEYEDCEGIKQALAEAAIKNTDTK